MAHRALRTALDRVNENSFNAVALKAPKMMALLRKIADPGDNEDVAWVCLRQQMVRHEVMAALGYSSKLSAEWAFLDWQRCAGRRAAEDFLRDHTQALGLRSSPDLDSMLAGV